MKTRVQRGAIGSPTTPPPPLFYRYLKPGALAQLRYAKITARSRDIGAQTLLALNQLDSGSDSALPQPDSANFAMDRIPSFNLRVTKHPRCLQRKKLIAVTPSFPETQS